MTGLALVSLVVRDYDEAIAFYVGKLGFALIEDSPAESSINPGAAKRWVVVAPPGGERGAGAGGATRPTEGSPSSKTSTAISGI